MIKKFRILGYRADLGFFPISLFNQKGIEQNNEFENYSLAEIALSGMTSIGLIHDAFKSTEMPVTQPKLKEHKVEFSIKKFIELSASEDKVEEE